MSKRVLYENVGPVWPADYARNRRHPWPEAAAAAAGGAVVAGNLPAGEAERVLRRIERNFIVLTRTVPMAEIEDLPPSMQPHVVGAPRMWVWLFRHLSHAVDYYNRAHRPWTCLYFWHATSTYLYIFFEGISPVTRLLVPFLRRLHPSMYSGCLWNYIWIFMSFLSYGSFVQKMYLHV